jgi:predicted RNA-binding Zn ribbon-like protein
MPRELPIVGGHLALDFANTVDDPLGPARHDHLESYADLVTWALRVEIIGADAARSLVVLGAERPRQAAAVLRRAGALRDALNDVFGAVVEKRSDLALPWEGLRPHVVRATEAARITTGPDETPVLSWSQGTLDHALHEVASAGAALLLSAEVARVKRCARCPWLFLDHSKNHSRRWCDMNDCGRAEKIERILERRRRSR